MDRNASIGVTDRPVTRAQRPTTRARAWRLVASLAWLLAAVTSSGAAATQAGGQWTFADRALRVAFSETTATWEVLDQRCQRWWRQAAKAPRPQVVIEVPRLASPVTVDGRLTEWPGRAALVPTSRQAAAGVKPDERDCSARCQIAWDQRGCWLAADVRDDQLVPFAAGANLWDVDSVELWLGQDHWGFAPRGQAVEVVCWSDPALAAGCQAAWQRTDAGWTLEAFVPWAKVPAVRGVPRAGAEVLFAVGVNDADGRPGRRCQLFWPDGYRHKVFETHAIAQFSGAATASPARRETRAPRDVKVSRVRPLPAPAEGVLAELVITREGNPPLPVTVRLALSAEPGDLVCEISAEATAAMRDTAWPAPFVLDAPDGMLVIPHQSGLLFGVRELEYDQRALGGMYSMPWFGATDPANGQGYLAIQQTPDDATFRGARVPGATGDVLAVQPVWQAQKGQFGYPRRLLYHFADRGGYVALAKRYRAYAAGTGLLKTLAQKRRERPGIDRLVGAVNIYAGGNFGNIAELKRLGVDRALVSGFGGAQVRAMNELGYLTTRYDIYTDLYEPGTPPSKWERCEGFSFPGDVIKTAGGLNQIGWCPVPNPQTGRPDPSYVICWTCGLRTLREKLPKRLSAAPLGAIFLDCVTSAGLYECYDPRHPLTRTTDREARTAQFAHLSRDLGLVAGSEAGRDWAVPVADYFEGLMSTATWFAVPQELHALPFEPITTTPRYEEFGLNPARRVPLFQLVYGDCAETSWWWGDNNTRMVSAWAQKDLLQMIHASMPMWILWQPQQGLFQGNLDRFKECYDHVCRWRRAVGYHEMINHERLSRDGLLQRSSFANGAAVVVNFAREPRTVPGGPAVPPRSFLIQGDAAQLPGLPVGQPVTVRDDWQPREVVRTGNTGFESGPLFWSASDGMTLDVQEAVVHSGRRAAKLAGTQTSGWSFASAVAVPVQPGRRYRVRGWVRIDAIDPRTAAPCLKCGLNQGNQWLTNFFTPGYDLARLGTWQQLETTFTAPPGATTGHLALEKRTTAAVTATVFIDDLELVAVP